MKTGSKYFFAAIVILMLLIMAQPIPKGSGQIHFHVTRKIPMVMLVLTFLLVICLLPSAALGQNRQGPSQPLASEEQAADSKLPTLFVVGDSTANNNANGARGWGDPFTGYFDPAKINVLNRARAGRSSRTFFSEGLWEKVLQ